MREYVANMTHLHYLSVVTFLLAPIAFSVAELSGVNLCHKRETYTVTMRVLVKEPVQVKSYTWCLKVPPRCTKYKVEMRDKFKIQTELRERVIDTCCAGYAPDKSETHCLPVCSGCLHGVCASPDTCTCEPGYTGDNCDTECGEGLWGAECKQECLCKNGAICHHVTGDCKCSEGWRGLLCDVPCPKGTYGHACFKECNCSENGTNSTCHHITGDCLFPETTHMTYPSTTAESKVTEVNVETFNEITIEEHTSTVIRTSVTNSEITVLPTTASITTTQYIPLPNTEKHVLYNDEFTTAAPVSGLNTITITTPILTTAAATVTITEPTKVTVFIKEEMETTMQNEHSTNSIKEQPWYVENEKPIEHSDGNESDNSNSLDNQIITEKEGSDQTKEEEASTEPQNIQIPSRGIIVVSDGLMSDRRNEEESVNENKNSKNSLWDLVSSVSVAGGVALALIVMAALTLLVTHLRNKKKISISGDKTTSANQQATTPGPQMYNYTEDVTTLPLRHLFTDVTYQQSKTDSTSDGLQLRFGDVASPANSIGQPYNDMRAYLELQYDIPPSSISSFQPGLEPEHLYDEIPCWRSNTTDTDTSRC